MRPQTEAGQRQAPATELRDPQVRKLPKKVQEGISEAIKLAEQVKIDPPPRTIENLEQILPRVNDLANEIIDKLKPHRKEDNSWSNALDTALVIASRKSVEVGRGSSWTIVYDIMNRKLPYHDLLAFAGTVAVVGDQEGIENPFMPILKLYVLGADHVYFDSISGMEYETLTMRFPISLRDHIAVLDAVLSAGDTKVRHLVGRGQTFHEIPSHSSK